MTDQKKLEFNQMLLEQALDKIKYLEQFIENELGIEAKEGISACALPTSYCADCGCGKKQRIEGKK